MGAGHQVSNVRTSKTAWLDENLDPILMRLSRRIHMVTGLETDPAKEAAEMLQVIQILALLPGFDANFGFDPGIWDTCFDILPAIVGNL